MQKHIFTKQNYKFYKKIFNKLLKALVLH